MRVRHIVPENWVSEPTSPVSVNRELGLPATGFFGQLASIHRIIRSALALSGVPFRTDYSDGKGYPWTGQVPGGAETVSVTRAGNTLTSESKKGGRLLFTTRITFSADGKVMTLTTKGTDADGKPVDAVRVYDKQ